MEKYFYRLYQLRNERGITQREAARQFYVSQSTYNNWENAKTEPSMRQLIKIADFYDVTVDYLLGRRESFGVVEIKLTQEQRRLFHAFSLLSNQQKQIVMQLLESISDQK